MEGNGGVKLPIGFRFHPTDEELLIHYLRRKVLSLPLPATVIPELEAFHFNPWDLPGEMKEKEKRYFFCRRKGDSMNKCRRTECGYWKLTGREKQIVGGAGSHVIGMRRSFVFFRGRGRKLKTEWVMQELRLVGSMSMNALVMEVGEWCVCRLYQRTAVVADRKKCWDLKNETTSCSSGITEISTDDLDEEASSQ